MELGKRSSCCAAECVSCGRGRAWYLDPERQVVGGLNIDALFSLRSPFVSRARKQSIWKKEVQILCSPKYGIVIVVVVVIV
jgi:hypothetical protein